MPNGRSSAAVERLVAPGYLLAALLVVVPLVDYLASIWPPRLGEVQWRYASEGLLAGFLLTPYLGLALASGVAAWREHGRALQWFGRLTRVAVAVLVVVSGDFALNVLQLRETVPPAALARCARPALAMRRRTGSWWPARTSAGPDAANPRDRRTLVPPCRPAYQARG